MEEQGTIVLDVKMEDLIASLGELKAQYDANATAMKELKEAGEQDSAEYVKLANTQKVLRSEMGQVEKQIQNNIKQERAQKDSLDALRAKLANLNRQYDSMSGMDRMGRQGQELQKKIKGLNDQIMGLEAGTGRFQRNVGNYQSALQGMSASFTQAGIAAGGLNKAIAMLKLSNPIIIAVTAAMAGLVGVAKKVGDAFKANEETTNDLKEAMSALNPVTDKVNNMFDKFATGLNYVVRVSIDKLTYTIYELLDGLQQLGNWFGADWHMGDNFMAGSVAARKLQQDENNYIKHKREWVSMSAKLDKEVAELREKSTDKENYTAEQRMKFLDEAIAKEEYKAKIEKKLAEQNLDLLRREAARGANDAEANDKLAEAEAAVYRAETNLFNVRKSLGKQRQGAAKEIEAETKKTETLTGAVKQLREQLEQIKMVSVAEATEAAAKKNKELADSIKKVIDNIDLLKGSLDSMQLKGLDRLEKDADSLSESLDAAANKIGNAASTGLKQSTSTVFGGIAEAVQDTVDKIGTSVAAVPSAFEQLAAKFGQYEKDIEDTVGSMTDAFGSLSSIYQGIADDESRSAEEREAAAKKAKQWAKLQIAANAGVAIAKGTAAAMDMPFPANIPALASVLAAVLSAIAQAKSLAGDAGAAGAGAITVSSSTGGNAAVTGTQYDNLTRAVNGGGNDDTTSTLAAMLSNMPAPVLVYSEFQKFGKSVTYANNRSKLQ